MDRPRRVPEDGRTMLERAQDLKEKRNYMKGTLPKTSFAFKSNDELLQTTLAVNISFSSDNMNVDEKINLLKDKELQDRSCFEEQNPEVNLPSNLDVIVAVEEFPPLTSNCSSPDKDLIVKQESWLQVASKSCALENGNLKNDRSILEH